MMRTSILVVSLCLLLGGALPAQLLTGQILGVDGSNNQLDLRSVGGATATTLNVTTGGSIETVIWDPTNPDRAYCTGYIFPRAYLSRLDFTPTGVAVTKVVDDQNQANPLRNVTQLSWSVPGQILVAADVDQDAFYEIDLGTAPATITPLTSSNQLWGNGLDSGARDPLTTDVFAAGNSGTLYRVSFPMTGAPAVNPLLSGLGSVHDVVFDPRNASIPEHHVLLVTDAMVWRVDVNNPLATATPFLDAAALNIAPLRSMTLDEQGGFVVGNQFGDVYRVPNPTGPLPVGGVAATYLGTLPLGFGHRGLTVVGGGELPWSISTTAIPGGGLSYSVSNTPAGLSSGYTLISTTTYLSPAGTGPMFGIWPDAFTLGILATNPVPVPGSFFHWTTAPLSSLFLPPGALTANIGQTWDFVLVGFAGGELVAWSRVQRVTLL